MDLAVLKHCLPIPEDKIHVPFDVAVRVILPPRHALPALLHAAHAGRIQRVLGPQQPHMPQHRPVRPHQLRHACASNVLDAGCGIDVAADLLGHASVSSSQVYIHPDPARLRAAVDAVPSPREQAGVLR